MIHRHPLFETRAELRVLLSQQMQIEPHCKRRRLSNHCLRADEVDVNIGLLEAILLTIFN